MKIDNPFFGKEELKKLDVEVEENNELETLKEMHN